MRFLTLVLAFLFSFAFFLKGNAQNITVLAPNGGETLAGCSNYNIRWTATGTSNYFYIDYSVNNGTSWASLATNIQYNGGVFTWTVPNISTSQALIRVRDAVDTNIIDQSNAVFTITPALVLNSPNGGEVWQGGTYQNISWVVSSGSSTYQVEYSTNAGVTWTSIATTTNNSYYWLVPNTPSSTAMIRVRDINSSCRGDVSDNLFNITAATPNITVNAPWQGAVWTIGTGQTISWTNSYLLSNTVHISISLDSGMTWSRLYTGYSTGVSGGNVPSWVIPNTPSNRAIIKVVATNDTNVVGYSGVFTIPPFFTITSPNASGISWNACTNQYITFNKSASISSVKLEYSLNGGQSWILLTSAYYTGFGTTGSYLWSIPDLPSSTVRIRVTDPNNSTRFDVSDNDFTIVGDTSIILNSPIGGEVWQGGTTQVISWAGNNTVSGRYSVYYSTNNGQTWNTIIGSTYTNSYSWLVPNLPSSGALIRVEDYNNTCKNTVSPAPFTITPATPQLYLTYPNGGEQLSPGSSVSISWYSNYLSGSFVKLEYSVDSGANWTTIIGNTSLTAGSYAWTVPNIPTNRAWVRVSSTTQTQVMDTSNATFTITPFFTITTPNGGQSWQGCSSQYIYFNKSTAIGYVKLDYSLDSGRTWLPIIANTYVGYGTTGSYYWSPLPNTPSNNALIRVSDVNVPSRFDISDVVFQLVGDQSIVMNAPNGGEIWQGGTYQNITWAGNSSVSGRYSVEYSINGGLTWTTITSSTYNTSYYWLIPNLPTTTAKIRVSDYYNTCKNSVSAQNFTITAATPQLFVTYPNGGEQLSPGSSVSISWYGQYLPTSNFKIEYSADSGATWTVLSSSVSSTATNYAWTVPNANSSRMLVKVSLTSFPAIADTSNATFTVIPYFTITSPNGGQSWQGCSSQYIYFNKSTAIGYVKLDYSLDSGRNWLPIIANTYVGYGSSGSYYWSPLPNTPTNNALVRVSDVNFPTRLDESDVVFQIVGDQSVVMNAPNGGETWQGGTYQNITWAGNASVSGRYSVEYSINGGLTWTTITSSTYNTSYYWLVPNLPTSTARIRVSDYYNTCKNAVSAQNFIITAATPQLFLTTPNGGNQLFPGTSTGIYWSNNYVPGSFVKLEYSTDSGATWTTIINNTSLSTGFYNWLVPNIPTTRALVRISSVTLPNVMDTSNAVFTIRPYLTITSPSTPGLSYPSCSNQYIYFEKSPVITYVKVDYSTDSMATWTTYSSSYYVGGSTSASIYWSLPSLFTNHLFMRVSDVNNPTTRLDVTDYPIVVRGDSSIVLNTPNGGETWQGGTYQNITWAGNATVSGRYQVEYSINNGITWTLLTSSTYNTSYYWLLPNTPTSSARVRVTDYYNTCKNAVSNQSFTITAATPTLTVSYPNGGEGFYPGTSVSISWSSSYLPTSNLKLEYSTNGGSSWTTISSSISSSTFNYSWTVPDIPTTQALVRISLTSFPQIADTSNNTFTIYPYFTITTPNGGQSWQGCSYQYLYFNKSSALGYLKLDYSLDNGSTWNVISANTYVGYGTSASYYWQVPNQASSNALIRVSDPNVPSRFDVTDVPFTIVPDYAIALNAPLGGEQWRAGTYQSISWAGNISVSGRYTLEYSINGGVSWNTITSGIYGTTYNWLIPNTPSTQVVIRVSDYNNTCKQTINNIFFTILPGIPTYIVTTPNGGEVVYSGASSYIYWSSQYVTGSFTKIEYSLDSGRVWTTIVNATNNSGSYLWSSIPAVYTNQALIRISDYNNPSVTDVSNSVFTIRKPITVTAPDGMEFVGGCTYTTISFNRGGASNYIKMEYSLNNGVSWNIITSSQYFATLEVNYNWLVPNLDGRNSCLVRVSDANNAAKFDVSDSTFTIFPAIRLIEPAYGGVFVGGTTRNITWWDTLTSDYYNIEYSLNNGSTWTIIAANTFIGNNTYAWTVPNIASTSALIRITDFQNTCKQSLTSISFSIAQVPNALTLNNPIGGNTYLACQVVPISWTASGTVGNVILEYSANAGTSWVALATNQPNVGSYNWTVPNLNSNNYLIRVRDITNSQIYDICNGTLRLVATQANAGSAKLICSGDSVRLDGTGNGTFSWTGSGLSQTNTASPWAKPTQTTTYQLTVTNVYGCTATSSTAVTVQVKPVLQVTGATLCLGTSSSISATGANSYSWSPVSGLSNASSSSPIANPSSTTTYQVIGTTNGCSDTESVVVTVNPIPATPVISNIGNLTFCSGDSVLLNSSASVGNQWFLAGNAINGANQTGFYAKTTGAYSVRTTVNGCSASSASINVSVQPRPLTPIITNSRSLNFCSGDSVILTSSALAGNVWSTGANSRSIVVKSSGTYTVLIQGAGCSSGIASATVQVTQSPSAPTLTASGATTFCSGDSLRITSSTGTGMNWSTGATNVSSILVRASGTISGYVVANGCSSAVSNAVAVTVNPTPSAPTITANRPTTFCQGDSVVISSTGTENKLWSNGSTGNSLVVTSSGIYSVRSFALGCTSTVSNSISVLVNSIPATPTLTASTATTFCSGDSLRITSSTGTGMNWSTGATNVSSIVVRTSGTISGYVVANGCSSAVSNSVAVTVNPTPSAPTITANRPTTFCQGDSVVISSTGTENKLWSNGSTGNSLVVTSSGIYSVRSFALGCTSTVSNSISVLVNSIPATPTLTASTATTFCSGDSLRITSSTGTGMNWSTGATNVSSIVVRTSGTISGYVVANGCSSAVSNAVAVTVNPTPSAPTITANRPTTFCQGDSVVISSTGTENKLWSNGSTGNSLVVTSSGIYSVRSFALGCTSTVSNPISVLVNSIPATPTLTASGATTFCSGDSLRITSSTGMGMNWSTGATNVSSIVVRASGTISGYVVANGCSSAVSNAVAVTVNPTPSAPTITANRPTTFCQGDSVVISSTGTENKLWSNGAVGNSIVAKSNGVYTVRAYALGCTSTVSNPISVLVNSIPATPTLTASTATTFCSGDSLRITSSTGTGMNWSTGATNVSSIVVRTSGTISGYVVANGCSSALSNAVAVTVNPTPSSPTITTSRNPQFCLGDSVQLSFNGSGTPLWSNGSSNSSIWIYQTQVLTVQSILGSCTSSVSLPTSVLVSPVPTAPIISSSSMSFCSNDSLLISSNIVQGMYWSTGASTSQIYVRNTNPVYGYVIQNGCASPFSNIIQPVMINSPMAPTIVATGNTTFCQGDSVRVTSNSVSVWSTGDSTISIVVRNSGTFTARNQNQGCYSDPSNSIQVLVNPIPSAPVVIGRDTSFCQGDSVQLSITPSQGSVWNTGSTNSSIFVKNTGIYSAVRVALGCTSTVSNAIVITVNPRPLPPTITPTGSALTFCQGDSVVITSSALFGNTWNTGDTSSSIVIRNNLPYYVKSTNAFGCSSAFSSPVNATVHPVPAAPQVKKYAYTLVSDSSQVQWFLNGSPIPGAINNKFTIQLNGIYTCGVRNGLNCWAYSAPIVVKDAVLGDVDIDKELLPTEKSFNGEFKFSVYPNPTNGQLNVLWRGELAVGLLEVFDGSGRKVASKVRSNESQSTFDLEHLKPGMYWIRYSDIHHTETQKFIIQR